MEERHERRDVVALEGVDVAGQEVLLLGVDRGRSVGVEVDGRERGPRALERAVDRGDARVEQLGHLGGLPAQHLAQDQHGALAGRQVLQRGDERQADRVSRGGQFGRVAVGRQHPGVGHGQDPRVLGQAGRQRSVGARRRPQVHRPGPALRSPQHVEAHVGGDAIEPRPQRGAAFEAVDGLPGPHHRLLHGVLGLEARAQHPVAVGGQLPAVRLEIHVDLSDPCMGIAGGGVGTGGHGRTC